MGGSSPRAYCGTLSVPLDYGTPSWRAHTDRLPLVPGVGAARGPGRGHAPACASAAPGSSWSRIGALAESLREHPMSAVVPGPSGALERVSMDVTGLVNLVSDAAEDLNVYRELDASARALLAGGDPAPLLRLYAQRLAVDETYFGTPFREYSVELYLAASCLDYPQLFDMDAGPSVRAGDPEDGETVLATLTAEAPGVRSASFTATWTTAGAGAEAQLVGAVGAQPIAGSMPAP